MLPNFSYVKARSLEEAVDHLASEGARAHAGGTDLLGCLRDGVFGARVVVALGALPGLRGITEASGGGLRIGALTTLAEVAASPAVAERYPVLAQAAGAAASPQLRNQGTLGGNLCQKPRCWYYRGEFHCLRKGGPQCFAVAGENQFHCILGGRGCYIVHPSDTAPALVALGARVRIAGPRGTRTLPVEELFVHPADDPRREVALEPGELVTEVVIPPPPQGLRSAYRKVRARQAWDFALAGAALALVLDGDTVTGGRVVLSGAAPFPWRSTAAEEALRGKTLADAAPGAARAAVADATPLAQNAYKVRLFRGLLEAELPALGG